MLFISSLTLPWRRPKALILDKWANLHQERDLVLSLCQVKHVVHQKQDLYIGVNTDHLQYYWPTRCRWNLLLLAEDKGRGEGERSKGRSVWCIWDGSKSGREGTRGQDGSETSL